MRSQILHLPHSEATYALGQQLGQALSAGSVLLLQGNLGAGKTTLIQGLGAGLGMTEPIDSPTFTLVNEYLSGRVPLYHFDLYRLDSHDVAALYPETYWDAVEVEPGIVAIEWSDRLPYKPSSYLQIHLIDCGELGRQATIDSVGGGNGVQESLLSKR